MDGAGVNPLDVLSAEPATPFDDVNTPAAVVADEHPPTNDGGHAAGAQPADGPAVPSADEPAVAHTPAEDTPAGPGIGEAVVNHIIGEAPSVAGADLPAVAADDAHLSSEPAAAAPVTPAAEHPVSDPPVAASADEPKADAGDLHTGDPVSAHLADEPITGADAGTLEPPQPAEPAQPALVSVDADAYENHLHELNSDQLLDEAFHQGQPELRRAALEELRHRLHGDEAPSTGEHEPIADPIAAAVEEPPHEPAAEPSPEELPSAEAPEPLSAQGLETLLDEKAGATDETLEWKSSVVDLLKLCGMDSSQEAREHYAVELGFPADELGETPSSELNMWLHGQLLSTLERNGGNLPAELA